MLKRVYRTYIHKPLIGYLILASFMTFAIGRTYYDEKALCVESHRRYDTLQAVIITSTTISPISRQRLSASQLKQYEHYQADFRQRLLAELGAPPTC